MKEKYLLDLLNKMIQLCEPFKYQDFNLKIRAKNIQSLRDIEKESKELGLSDYGKESEGISTLSIIATITDVLIQKRLGFVVAPDGTIVGVSFPEDMAEKALEEE